MKLKSKINYLIKKIMFFLIYMTFRIIPLERKKIFCMNFNGKGYGDNPKYIIDEIIKNKYKYKIVWGIQNRSINNFPKEVITAKMYSFKWFYHLCTSKIWINNCRFPSFVIKRKKQFYIQTWHGGLGLKKIEKEAIDTLSEDYVKDAKNDSKMIDLVLSNSTYRTNIYKNYFWYNGNILECGLPRNDIFFNKKEIYNYKNKISKMYNFDKRYNIILYAPTFRTYDFNYFLIDFEKIISELERQSNEKYIVLIKLHPNLSKINYKYSSKRIINVSDYPDIYELLTITDLLISDYSSVIFDFIYMKKPIYLYAPDHKKYVENRGLKFIYEDLPFSISYETSELVKNISKNDYKNHLNKLSVFLNKIKLYDNGNASKEVVKIINSINNGGNINEKI